MARDFASYAPLPVLDVHARPPGCHTCPYGISGGCVGFCPSWVPPNPLIAVLLEAAGENEIADKQPLTGGTGRYFNWALSRIGHSRNDVLLDNTIRGHPQWPAVNKYPVGLLRKQAEEACRQYDGVQGTSLLPGGLLAWPADCLVFSIHPAAVARSQNLNPLIAHVSAGEPAGVLAKAFRLAAAGRKPLVLMGDKPKDLVAPEYKEGITKLIGHIHDLRPGELKRRLAAVHLRDDIGRWWESVK